ncbi:MAG: nitric oxide dioxygenase [Deltaproteobacteria bacterium]|nr:nitric oxide dioxygenase [Kofleriaceae bacterium]
MIVTPAQKQAIRRSWELVKPIADTAADLFYKRLFEIEPAARTLFAEDMTPQKKKLLAMLAFIVKSLDWPDETWREQVDTDDDLFLVVLALGRRHADLYHVSDASYDSVGAALLWTLDYGLGEAFTAEVRDAWTRVYGLLATTMKMGKCAVGDGTVVARPAAARREVSGT